MVGRRATTRRPLTGDAPPPGAFPEPELFAPDSRTRRLDREAFLLLGAGPRALLLQVAHPAVAAGVDEHSGFRTDPWGRLAATLRSYLRIVYGSGPAARAEVARLRALHGRVRGSLPGGGRYEATDPSLALWVHATLVDSTIVTADRWLAPLSRAERAGIYAESLPMGRAFGIPSALLPPDLEAFEAYLAASYGPSGPVHPGNLARELARVILHPPAGPAIRTLLDAAPPAASAVVPWLAAVGDRLPAALTAWLLWPSLELLPASVRAEYHLPDGPGERLVSAWLVRTWRAWASILPSSLRTMPQARAADLRAAEARAADGRAAEAPAGGDERPAQ